MTTQWQKHVAPPPCHSTLRIIRTLVRAAGDKGRWIVDDTGDDMKLVELGVLGTRAELCQGRRLPTCFQTSPRRALDPIFVVSCQQSDNYHRALDRDKQ